MLKQLRKTFTFMAGLLFSSVLLTGHAAADTYGITYKYNAALINGESHPGVYEVKIQPENNLEATLNLPKIGIPSIAKQTLDDHPTTESPAIIMGAAKPFEAKTGPTEFTRIDDGTRAIYPPYNYFRYQIMEEKAADGTTHRKLSGFDGSYVIIRVDVSDLINAVPESDRAKSYLHVKQEGNAALQVALGKGGTNGAFTYADALGNKAGSYSLADGAKSLKDTSGTLTSNPYLDIILMSSGTLVAGADTGTQDPTVLSADFKVKFYVDQVGDYNPDFDPTKYTPDPNNKNAPTADAIMMGKYFYDEKIKEFYPAGTDKPDPTVSGSYLVMGSDLELEVVNDDGARAAAPEYWSLRKALAYENYNNSPIKMICEVPVLEGLVIDGSDYTGNRSVIFDVNSFDIQIANHQTSGAAALTVKNATLTLKDGFNTTGAELAVGNNARMSIQEGGTLIIDKTCQLEVEYDAASTAPSSGQETTPDSKLTNGIISIESGGQIINNGILTIEGTEGKPIDPAAPSIRDKKDAVLNIMEGGTLENNGCLLSYGELYCMGTIINNGKYDDLIESKDPDKGNFTYHKGIQISWKDDVTQDSVYMGHLYVGVDGEKKTNPDALLENHGDVVLVPGILECYGKFENAENANIYVCPVTEAIIPVNPPVDRPLEREAKVRFGTPMKGYLDINKGGSLKNDGVIRAAEVEIVSNGRTGKLTPMDPSDKLFTDMTLNNLGTAVNNGTIVLDSVNTFGEMTNTGSIETKVVVSSNTTQEGILYDKAATKLIEVYNAALRVEGNTNIWSHAVCKELNVQPATQTCTGGNTPTWVITAVTETSGEGIQYFIEVVPTDSTDPTQTLKVEANKETQVSGPVLPYINNNILYHFYVLDGTNGPHADASVTVSSDHETPPSAIGDLVYNGKEQALVTAGGSATGTLEYRLGADGKWSSTVPAAKDAGTYTVYYRLAGNDEAGGSAEVKIAPRPVTVSAVDMSSRVNEPLKELEYTVSGIVAGDELGEIEISSTADSTKTGAYPITVTGAADNPNYLVTLTNDSRYTVTSGGLEVTAKDKYGVFSDELTYKGFNIDLVATPSNMTPYYNVEGTELTDDNYSTAGTVASAIKDLPAGAGTHTVYYYVKNDATGDVVRGSKQVIIEKAEQKAPDKLITRAESYKDSGDGIIQGLEPRVMEYRRADNDGTYTTAYLEKVYVRAGIYLVRRIGDRNHYPSPDCAVTVGTGDGITVSFYRDQDDLEPISTVEGLAVGDLVPRPEDPVWEGHIFLGWFHGDDPFDFTRPVTMSTSITAHWSDAPAHVHTLKFVDAADPTCTEDGNKAYYYCTECGLWFEDATALIKITDRASMILKALGHSWDSGTVTKEATYTEEGVITYTCIRNSTHIKTEMIPKKERAQRSSGGSGGSGKGKSGWISSSADGVWSNDALGWHYIISGAAVRDEWRFLSYNAFNYWYYFDAAGTMKTGWLDWKGQRYYLWPVSDGWMGRMLTGWQQIDGKWYYFETEVDKNQGHMYRSCQTPDGFHVDADGVWDGKPATAGR